MIVIISGMQRSGSTFSFNVARELLLENEGGVTAFASNSLLDVIENDSGENNLIIKSHDPDESINAVLRKKGFPCICTIRKPEDAILSWMQTFGFSIESSVETYHRWLTWHRAMSSNMLNIRYEEVDKYPILTIRKISQYLINTWSPSVILKIWWRYRKSFVHSVTSTMEKNRAGMTDIGFSYFDDDTFFHRRHISSLKSRSAVNFLSGDEIKFIRNYLDVFLDKNGDYHW